MIRQKHILLTMLALILLGCDDMMAISPPDRVRPTRIAVANAAPTAFAAMSTSTPVPQPTATQPQLAPTVERPPLDLSQFPDEGVVMTEITHTADDGSVTWRTLFYCYGVGWVEVYREGRHHPLWWYEDYIMPRKSFVDVVTNEMVIITTFQIDRVAWECQR